MTVIDVRVSESPVFIVTDADSGIEEPNVPAELADHSEISVTTSPLVPAQFVHAGAVPLVATDPADADAHVAAGLVVTLETFDVPADPGVPVCSWTLFALVPVMLFSAALATVVLSASATRGHLPRP